MRHVRYQASALQKRQPVGYRFHTDSYDLFQVIYVLAGQLVFKSENEDITLTGGYTAILRKGSRFTLSCPERGYTGVGFHAIGELPAQFEGKSEVLRGSAEMQTLARLMQKQFSEPGVEFALEIDGLARTLGWEAVRLSETMGQMKSIARSAEEWAMAAKAALDANIYTATTANEALALLPLSYRQISRYFLAVFKMSPKHYQLMSKINAARELLTETGLSVTMIAMELGFSSSQHFATQFRSIVGKTPRDYRDAANSA